MGKNAADADNLVPCPPVRPYILTPLAVPIHRINSQPFVRLVWIGSPWHGVRVSVWLRRAVTLVSKSYLSFPLPRKEVEGEGKAKRPRRWKRRLECT